MNFCFSLHNSWSLHTHRFVFQSSEGEPQPTQAEASPRSPEAAPQQENLLGADPERYFEERTGHILNLIDRFSGINPQVARQMALQEQEQMGNLQQEYLSERSRLAAEEHPELQQRIQKTAQHFIERVQLKLQVQKKLTEKPGLQALYDQLKDRTGRAEEFLLEMDRILEREKNPDVAIQKIMGAMYRQEALGHLPKEPAKPHELVTWKNRLNVEQMEAVYGLIGVDFNRLNFSAEQMAKLDIAGRTLSPGGSALEGMTYLEAGLLDANGRIQPDGWERLFAYQSAKHNVDTVKEDMAGYGAMYLRSDLGKSVPFLRALQTHTQEHYGKRGALPTITFADRTFDLNEISDDYEREVKRFSEAMQGQSLQTLFDYRFDENTGVLEALSRNHVLPEPIRGHLEAIGMAEPRINPGFDGKISGIEFKYQGIRMEIQIGKHAWSKDDQQPYLRVHFGYRTLLTKAVDLQNIDQELQQAHQFHAENKKQAEQLMRDFFPGENPDMPAPWGGIASRTMLDLKEEYLSSLAPPQATDLQGVSPERISQINKILPMLLANQQALGISDDMNVFEALMKVYTAPNAEALLHQNYQSVIDELKDAHGPHYVNVEPAYRWKESMDNRDEMVTRSRTSEDPDYKARKEQLSKMKPGDKLNVTFEGESYSFMLADSFQNHQYRFKLEEFPEMADFEISVVDLVDRTPEEQLQYMMGSSFRRATIEMEKLMQDLNLRLPEKRKALSLKREYPKGKLTKPLLERLPFNKEQITFLTQFNTTHPLQLQLNTNKYDTITSLEVKWRNEEEKTNYHLSSVDGNYWRMHSLKDTSSKRTFLGYDLRTNELDAKIKKLA